MRLVVPTLALALLLPLVAGQSAAPVADLPEAVVGGAAVATPIGVLLFGGRGADAFSDAVQRYDPATGEATVWARMPAPFGASEPGRYESAAVLLGDAVYVFGGAAQVPQMLPGRTSPTPVPTSVDEILRVDLATGEVTRLPDTLPEGRWGLAGVAYDGTALLVGGFTFDVGRGTNGRHADVLRFDPAAPPGLRVTRLGALPYPVQDAVAGVLDGRLVVAGGLADHAPAQGHVCPTQSFFNSTSGEWETATIRTCEASAVVTVDPATGEARVEPARLPSALQWASGAVVGDRLLLAGGKLSNGAGSSAVLAWTPRGAEALRVALPQSVIAAGGAGDAAGLYVLAGRSESVQDIRSTVLRYDASPDAWPGAPQDLALEATEDGGLLSWTPPVWEGDSPVTEYVVTRDGAPLGSTTGLSLLVPDAGQYAVRAVNAHGEGDAAVLTLVPTFLATPPGAPEHVRADSRLVLVGRSSCVSWSAPADDGGAPILAYRVWRDGAAVGEARADETRWCDSDAPLLRDAAYRVTAVNAAGEGPASEAARVEATDIL